MVTISTSQQRTDDQFLFTRRIFHLLGVLSLLMLPVLLFVQNAELVREIPYPFYGRVVVAYAVIDCMLGACGVGLLRLKKWAAVVLSGAAALWAGFNAFLALQDIHAAASVIGFGYVVLFAVPPILTIWNWRSPIWR